MTWPRYPEYKDSGAVWLQAVPSHWRPVRIGTLFDEVSEPGNEHLPILSVSIHDGVSDKELSDEESDRKVARSDDRSKYKAVAPGDLTYNMMRAWQGGFGTVSVSGMVSPAYVVARPKVVFATEFVEMVLRTPNAVAEMKRHSRGITDFRLRLYWDDFKTLQIAMPPLAEQRSIVAFVGRETARIDKLIAEQERLLVLLAEKHQTISSSVIIRGLAPNVAMKNSGVTWLGQVPAHWRVSRLKRVVSSIEQGWSPQCENYPADDPEEWGVLKVGCVNGGTFERTENKKLPPELNPLPEYALKQGDLLISRANTRELVGSAAVVPADFDRLLLCDKLYRLRLNEVECLPEYVAAFLSTNEARSQIELQATGASSSMLNIGQGVLMDLQVPLPSLVEQREIIQFLRDEASRIDALTRESQRAVALLRERRSTLIAAAVTGQIDVRQA